MQRTFVRQEQLLHNAHDISKRNNVSSKIRIICVVDISDIEEVLLGDNIVQEE